MDSLTTPRRSCVVAGCRWGLSTPSAGTTTLKTTRYAPVVQVGAHVNSVCRWLKIATSPYPWRCVHLSVGPWLWLQDCGREPAADTLLIVATFNLRRSLKSRCSPQPDDGGTVGVSNSQGGGQGPTRKQTSSPCR